MIPIRWFSKKEIKNQRSPNTDGVIINGLVTLFASTPAPKINL